MGRVLCSDQHPLLFLCPLRIRSVFISGCICFHIHFRGFCIYFHFHTKMKTNVAAPISVRFRSIVCFRSIFIPISGHDLLVLPPEAMDAL